jgi:hypothetical protein
LPSVRCRNPAVASSGGRRRAGRRGGHPPSAGSGGRAGAGKRPPQLTPGVTPAAPASAASRASACGTPQDASISQMTSSGRSISRLGPPLRVRGVQNAGERTGHGGLLEMSSLGSGLVPFISYLGVLERESRGAKRSPRNGCDTSGQMRAHGRGHAPNSVPLARWRRRPPNAGRLRVGSGVRSEARVQSLLQSAGRCDPLCRSICNYL